jgi:hypothetical protein
MGPFSLVSRHSVPIGFSDPSPGLSLVLQLPHNALSGFLIAGNIAAMLLLCHFSIFAPRERRQTRHAPVVFHFLIGTFVSHISAPKLRAADRRSDV